MCRLKRNRVQKKNKIYPRLLLSFYRCSIESLLAYCTSEESPPKGRGISPEDHRPTAGNLHAHMHTHAYTQICNVGIPPCPKRPIAQGRVSCRPVRMHCGNLSWGGSFSADVTLQDRSETMFCSPVCPCLWLHSSSLFISGFKSVISVWFLHPEACRETTGALPRLGSS